MAESEHMFLSCFMISGLRMNGHFSRGQKAFRVKIRSLKFAMFLPRPLQTASVHIVNRATDQASCHLKNDSYRMGQQGCFD